MKSNKDVPDCNECGNDMEYWESLQVYYCKQCSIMYDPSQEKYWHTEEQEDEDEEQEEE